MRYTRTDTGTATPFDLTALKAHMRVTGSDEDTGINAMGVAAAAEIEAYCELALLSQTITATTDTWPGQTVALPVGPVAADALSLIHISEPTRPY